MAGTIIIVAAAVLFLVTLGMARAAAFWPRVTLALLSLFAMLILFRGVRRARTGAESLVSREGEGERLTVRLVVSPVLLVVLAVAYVGLITVIGFFPATVAFLVAYFLSARVRDWRIYILVISGVSIFIYLVFVLQLNLLLPSGLLFS